MKDTPSWLKERDFDKGTIWLDELMARAHALEQEEEFKQAQELYKSMIPGARVLLKHAPSERKAFVLNCVISNFCRKLELFEDAELHAQEAISYDKASFRASLLLYLALARSGKTREAIAEIWRYARYGNLAEYRDTISELVNDLHTGHLPAYRLSIITLAEKVGENL